MRFCSAIASSPMRSPAVPGAGLELEELPELLDGLRGFGVELLEGLLEGARGLGVDVVEL